jgi:hypothetical protein
MPQVGFEPTTLVFEWGKTVHASDRAATVLGLHNLNIWKMSLHNMNINVFLVYCLKSAVLYENENKCDSLQVISF